MNTFIALVKREFLEGKNGYVRTPVILLGLTVVLVVLTLAGIGSVVSINDWEIRDASNLGGMLERLQEKEDPDEVTAAVAIGYWAMTLVAWVALPFVVFFSLLGSLYEERRDRSILFWKSMPIADWQEVAAKLFTPVFLAPLSFLVLTIVAQIVIAVLLTIVVIFQGGPILVLWPLFTLFGTWSGFIVEYISFSLWMMPIATWVLLASAYAPRMPLLYALLPPVVLVVVEEIFFETHRIGEWIGSRFIGLAQTYRYDLEVDIDGPADLLRHLTFTEHLSGFMGTLTSVSAWAGLIVAALFFFGAVELRKRAL